MNDHPNTQLACQWFYLLILAVNLLFLIKKDIEGAAELKPKGFRGVIASLVSIGLLFLVALGAGAFSRIF